MKKSKLIYLSYILDENTPTYGNRNRFICEKKSDISKGNVANDSTISTTVHVGTHIDMPYHFFEGGQTIENFDASYFRFTNVLFIDILPKDIIVKDDLIALLKTQTNKNSYDMLVVKTGICHKRDNNEFWQTNYGFDPSIAEYLRMEYPNIRVIGFDSISVSSFANRILGKESHRAFLNPKQPILLVEDMDLTHLKKDSKIDKIDIAPLRIAQCDGLPCTIIAEVI
ncbi:cyclase family protein [Sulfurimonas sp.]|uniref:cyclase family protein n=1 Tax=Sulfurimonas sp. TaxID=2022749 RepID=UPI002624346F|nr:cyclase family protein [Sulfurimonas sp.]